MPEDPVIARLRDSYAVGMLELDEFEEAVWAHLTEPDRRAQRAAEVRAMMDADLDRRMAERPITFTTPYTL